MFDKSCSKRKAIISLIALSIFSLGCSNQVVSEVPSAMFKHWTHSHEEDYENINVYRTNEYRFPPSRGGRDGFELRENGDFIRYRTGATDKPEAKIGRWKSIGENKIEVFLDDSSDKSFTLDIFSSDENVLKIRQ